MHPEHTGIDMTRKIPEMKQIGNYVYRHGSRLSYKGELAGVTPARRKKNRFGNASSSEFNQ